MTEARRLSTSVPEKQDAIHLETLEAARQVAEVEIPVYKVLLRNPKIIACCLFANIGGLMYGFDHLALSLCLSMEPFQSVFLDIPSSLYEQLIEWSEDDNLGKLL